MGLRFAFNDLQSTAILAGAAIDRQSGASFVNIDASRRFGSRWTLNIEARCFINIPPDDFFLYGIRDDDYIATTWAFHF